MLILGLVAGGAWLLLELWQRRPGRHRPGLPAGLTLVTGPGCALCAPLEQALRRAGVVPRVVDIAAAAFPGPSIRSLPAAIVVDTAGEVVMQRFGRSALDDAWALAAQARTVTEAQPRPSRPAETR